jgi:glutamate synthase domain-containing protein 3
MTGGLVVVLGSVGANFGAGMTGGRAYLLDPSGRSAAALAVASVAATRLSAVVRDRADGSDRATELVRLIKAHAHAGSELADRILARSGPRLADFWLVEPVGAPVTLSLAAPAEPVVVSASRTPNARAASPSPVAASYTLNAVALPTLS